MNDQKDKEEKSPETHEEYPYPSGWSDPFPLRLFKALQQLKMPFPEKIVKFREGYHGELSYVEVQNYAERYDSLFEDYGMIMDSEIIREGIIQNYFYVVINYQLRDILNPENKGKKSSAIGCSPIRFSKKDETQIIFFQDIISSAVSFALKLNGKWDGQGRELWNKDSITEQDIMDLEAQAAAKEEKAATQGYLNEIKRRCQKLGISISATEGETSDIVMMMRFITGNEHLNKSSELSVEHLEQLRNWIIGIENEDHESLEMFESAVGRGVML